MRIAAKRVYDEPGPEDGFRILIDGLWPRGLSKEHARVDLWLKEIAPSAELRKRFGHDPNKWTDFQRRYREELRHKTEQLTIIKAEARTTPVTLVYGARDTEHNNAIVLLEALKA